jgi:hypothetical protein
MLMMFNILGVSVYSINKNIDALLVASKENGLEVNADKTKYKVMSRDQNAERSHNIKTDRSSSEKSSDANSFVFQFAIQTYKD